MRRRSGWREGDWPRGIRASKSGSGLRAGHVCHEWLLKFIEHRIVDKRVLRHIKKWLMAGVLEDGKIWQAEYGTPQGGSLSPLLANIYLHYALDVWADIWRKRNARGEMLIVRFADDSIFGFQYRSDAARFLEDMEKRFSRFHLEVNAEKTRLIELAALRLRLVPGAGKASPRHSTSWVLRTYAIRLGMESSSCFARPNARECKQS